MKIFRPVLQIYKKILMAFSRKQRNANPVIVKQKAVINRRKPGYNGFFGTPEGIRTPDTRLRSMVCPMPYGTDIIYGDSSFVIYFEVQGFCGAICTKCRVLPHFLRRPISKLLAGIALPTTSFHHALPPCR